MNFNSNPYYSPELCGLEILESIDTADSYEFDMFVVWLKSDDGTIWYDSDSGCSCPVPFENGRHDLQEVTKDTYYNFIESLENHYRITPSDIKVFKDVVKGRLGI